MKVNLLAIVLMLSIPAMAQTNWEFSSTGTNPNFNGYGMIGYGDTLYASGTDLVSGKRKPALYKSVNNGGNWQVVSIATQLPDTCMLYVVHHGGDYLLAILYVGSNFERWTMKVSNDGGTTWNHSLNGLDSTSEFIYSITSLGNGTLIAAGHHLIDGKCFFSSTDKGKTWARTSFPMSLITDAILNVHFVNQRLYCLGQKGQNSSNFKYSVHYSNDSGKHWKTMKTDSIPVSSKLHRLITTDNKDIYLLAEAQHELKIYHSSDSGNLWSEVSYSGLPSNQYVRFAHHSNGIFHVGLIQNSSTQIFRSNPLGLSAQPITAKEQTLFPNPATNSFSIDGLSPGSSIKIYDMQGKQVTNGIYKETAFDVSLLPQGFYVVKTFDGDLHSTVRFVKE